MRVWGVWSSCACLHAGHPYHDIPTCILQRARCFWISQGEKKEKAAGAGPAGKGAAASEPGVDALDIRVGQIVKVEQHPNAETLYVEEIDVGEEKPRQVSQDRHQLSACACWPDS